MRLSLDKRLRGVTLYEIKNLHFQRSRFSILKSIAIDENIICSEFSLRKLIKKYLETGLFKIKKFHLS